MQQWADAVGDQSWTWNNTYPFFKKSVDFTPPNYAKRGPNTTVEYDPNAFSASGGPLQVTYANYFSPISPYIRTAFAKSNISEIDGPNSGTLIGYAEYPNTISPANQVRSSSETSFMQDAISKTNMQVYIHTLAKKIVFDGNKTARAVQVQTYGDNYTLSATKEVILTAGPFRSPQLLMVSGIGPAAELQRLNVPVLSNLSGVGNGITDQPFFGAVFPVNISTQSQLASNSTFRTLATQQFLHNQSGPLTTAVANYLAWEKLPAAYRANFSASTEADLARYAADWPEIQLDPVPAALQDTGSSGNYMSMYITLLEATSRGNLTLASTDTAANPLVNLNFFQTHTDQQVAVAAYRRARDVAMASGIVSGPEYVPGNRTLESDEQILAHIRDTAVIIAHASSSCESSACLLGACLC